MEVTKYTEADFEDLVEMALDLWKDYSREELLHDLETVKTKQAETDIAKTEKEEYAGFVMVSVRNDYVEGATSSPVGYLEGIYVKNEFRNEGIARQLFKVAEQWALERNCTPVRPAYPSAFSNAKRLIKPRL